MKYDCKAALYMEATKRNEIIVENVVYGNV
jgi:hypothetical protein